MDRTTYITNQVQKIRNEIKPVHLLAVTKYVPVEEATVVYKCGQYDLGEARVTQLQEKSQYFLEHDFKNVRWHFIGHLQSNKINRLLKTPGLRAIHSIDSFKLLEALYDRLEHFQGEKLEIFIQIKTTTEDSKSGVVTYDELSQMVNFILSRNHKKIVFKGLMTMGPIRTEDFEQDALDSFTKLAKIRQKLIREYHFGEELQLSMGMTRDYKIAISAGSHWVRIGSLLFPPTKNQ